MSQYEEARVNIGEYNIIAGKVSVTYKGKVTYSYSGAAVVLILQDGSLIVHTPKGVKPQFFLMKPFSIKVVDRDTVVLNAETRNDQLHIAISDITFIGKPFERGMIEPLVATDGGEAAQQEPDIELVDLKMGGYYLVAGHGSVKYKDTERWSPYVGSQLILIKPDQSIILHTINEAWPYSYMGDLKDIEVTKIGRMLKMRIQSGTETWLVQFNKVSLSKLLFPISDSALSLGYLHKKQGEITMALDKPIGQESESSATSTGDDEYSRDEAMVHLRQLFGSTAAFRPHQWEAIDVIVNKKDKLLLVQSTGWGKSVVYFLATKLLRNRGSGPTIVISPLLSLMRNQMIMANKLGLVAETINSDNMEQWAEIEAKIHDDKCDLLLVSPERLGNERFLNNVIPAMAKGIGLFVIDEAHCISDWGHDFRPDYRRIVKIIGLMPSGMPLLATTATANNRVVQDVVEQVGNEITVIRGPLARHSLRLMTIRLKDQAERLAWLAENIPRMPGSGIIYCLTQKDCELVSSYLTSKGILVEPYHAGVNRDANETRERLENALLNNEVKALAATIALGMGFDKPDIGFVVHFQRPGSLVSYYQQIGRAGRNAKEAYGILLSGDEDDEIAQYFIDSAFPTEEEMKVVLDSLDHLEAGGTLSDIQANVNLSKSKVANCLKHLSIEGAISKSGKKYYLTPNPWKPDLEKSQRVTEQRLKELEEIRNFVDSDECLMKQVCEKLDDPNASRCGKCAKCSGDLFPRTVVHADVLDAMGYIRGCFHVIPVRKQWTSLVRIDDNFNIPRDKLNETGRALCVYGDAGWGKMVKEDKYHTKRFRDELVAATSEMVNAWFDGKLPENMWVTAVPSLRMPHLVPEFAKKLADHMGLPFHEAIVKVKNVPPQKNMENSEQQLRNIKDAFDVKEYFEGPVLLIDDMVDSRWTFTVCGYMLRKAGSGPVYPLALAITTKTGDK